MLAKTTSLKRHYYDFKTLSNGVQLGTLFGFGASPAEGHKIESQTLVLRSTDNEARIYEGFNRDVDSDIRVTRLRWIERMLLFEQLRGEHQFGDDKAPKLNWSYSFAWAKRAEPDRRETRYDQEDEDTWFLSDRPEGNQRFFSYLDDYGHNGIVSLAIPIGQTVVKVGFNASTKSRTVDSRRFKFMHKGPNSRDEDVLSQDPESVFVPENIGTDGFQFEEITRQTDNYTAQHDVIGAYALNETTVSERFRFMTGVRIENSKQTVSTFELFNPDQVPIDSNLTTLDVLPGTVATVGLVDDMQLRLGYGRTLSRPDFREMSPATFNDVTGGRQTYGNPDLTRATIDNVDFRWEWFPNPGEVIAASAFYKYFANPIETIVAVSAQHSVTYENALSAQNVGVEMEFRKSLGFIDPKLELFYFSTNTALIRSRVELGENSGIQTSNERPLQAQSPYVFNTQMGYFDPDRGHSATLLYNVFGPRIEEVGALGAPDVYLQPVHRLDAVVSVGLGKGWGFGLKEENLSTTLSCAHKVILKPRPFVQDGRSPHVSVGDRSHGMAKALRIAAQATPHRQRRTPGNHHRDNKWALSRQHLCDFRLTNSKVNN